MSTLKLCLIGNSHLAALKKGWEELGDLAQGFEPTFFGSHRTTLQELVVKDQRLEAVSPKVREALLFTSGGKDRIVPSEYDAFVLVGLGIGIIHIARVYHTHRLIQHITDPKQHPISEECLGEAVAAALWNSASIGLVSKLRTLTEAPIFVLPDPLPRALIKSHPSSNECWKNESILELLHSYYLQFQGQCESVGSFQFVPQPKATTTEDGMFTREEFSSGSVRLTAALDVEHEDDEMFHANPAYGTIFLQEVLLRARKPRSQ